MNYPERFEVLSRWPLAPPEVEPGQILTRQQFSNGLFLTPHGSQVVISYAEEFPMLLRKMDWWEKLSIEQLPSFVKINQRLVFLKPQPKIGDVLPVAEKGTVSGTRFLGIDGTSNRRSDYYCVLKNYPFEKINYSLFDPGTEQEWKEQQEKQEQDEPTRWKPERGSIEHFYLEEMEQTREDLEYLLAWVAATVPMPEPQYLRLNQFVKRLKTGKNLVFGSRVLSPEQVKQLKEVLIISKGRTMHGYSSPFEWQKLANEIDGLLELL